MKYLFYCNIFIIYEYFIKKKKILVDFLSKKSIIEYENHFQIGEIL